MTTVNFEEASFDQVCKEIWWSIEKVKGNMGLPGGDTDGNRECLEALESAKKALIEARKKSPVASSDSFRYGSCFNCKFWDCTTFDEGEGGWGLCVRYAPRPLVGIRDKSVDDDEVIWPQTRDNQVCGEFEEAQARETAQ